MKAIIIAAGPSTRLSPLTDDRPKCMLKVKGRPIIQNMINLFRNNGVSDISVIRGYKKEKINFSNITYFENSEYKDNNILHSLITAREKLEEAIRLNEDIIVSYSDIWYEDSVVKKLLESQEDISAIVDTDWEEYYDGRTDHPISEAEKVIIGNDNKILKTGKSINHNMLGERHGEFIGLWKFTPEGAKVFLGHFDKLNSDLNKKDPFQSAKEWQGI
jgi:choline kinase